jgi:hypothetical protein
MIRSKTWVKDRGFQFEIGDVVKLVRKKPNGHPRFLELGCCYIVRRLENDDLFVQEMNTDYDLTKVNKNYFVPIEKMRDEIINDILNND